MSRLFTDASFQNIVNISNRYGVSSNAVSELAEAIIMSNGTMAQFNIPELGGGGQWMSGGMTMVGDMFNNQLKSTVNGLCVDLSNLLNQGGLMYKPLPKAQNQIQSQGNNYNNNWWGDLGYPNSTGSQNDTSYAIFSNINRLAVLQNGNVTVFDTLDNQIGGVGQQQGGNYSVSFTSQYGNVDLNSLPVISGGVNEFKQPEINSLNNQIENQIKPVIEEKETIEIVTDKTSDFEEDIFIKIEKIAALKDKGILSEEEFNDKKTDLLSRL